MLPVFKSKCCCCCAPAPRQRLLRPVEENFDTAAGGADVGLRELVPEPLPLPAAPAPAAGAAATYIAPASSRPAGVAEIHPVWVEAKCGCDRDCVPAGDYQPSFDQAVAGSSGWLAKDRTRYVQIFDKPGGRLLSQLGPEDPTPCGQATVTRAVQARVIEEQRKKLAGTREKPAKRQKSKNPKSKKAPKFG